MRVKNCRSFTQLCLKKACMSCPWKTTLAVHSCCGSAGTACWEWQNKTNTWWHDIPLLSECVSITLAKMQGEWSFILYPVLTVADSDLLSVCILLPCQWLWISVLFTRISFERVFWTSQSHSDQGKIFQKQKKKRGGACHLRMFTHTHTHTHTFFIVTHTNLRLTLSTLSRWTGREEGFFKFSFWITTKPKP